MKTVFDNLEDNKIIELEEVKQDDDKMVFWFNETSGKWCIPKLMVKRAEDDNNRLAVEQSAKDRL